MRACSLLPVDRASSTASTQLLQPPVGVVLGQTSACTSSSAAGARAGPRGIVSPGKRWPVSGSIGVGVCEQPAHAGLG